MALVAVEEALAHPPITLDGLIKAAALGALAGLVHYLPTLGTKDVIDATVDQKVSARLEKAVDNITGPQS